MAINSSLYVPGPRTPLNWTADPLYRVNKKTITPGQARAGLAYNLGLSAPDSPSLRALFVPPAAPPAPAPWTPQPLRPGMYQTPYGRIGQSTPQRSVAAAPVVVPTEPPPPLIPDFSADDSGTGGKRLGQFVPGASGALEAGSPLSPILDAPPPAENPNLAGGVIGTALVGEGAAAAQPIPPQQPVEDVGMAPSSQRYYDRKFGRDSHDPATRMMSRRTAPGAPNVSHQVAPVTFNNEVAGHSDWVPY